MFSSAVRKARLSLSREKRTERKKNQGVRNREGDGERERGGERGTVKKATEKEGVRGRREITLSIGATKISRNPWFHTSDRDEPPLSSSSPAAAVAVVVVHARRDSRFVLTPSPHKLLVFRSALAVTAYRYEQGN